MLQAIGGMCWKKSDPKTVRSAGLCFETFLSNRHQHLSG